MTQQELDDMEEQESSLPLLPPLSPPQIGPQKQHIRTYHDLAQAPLQTPPETQTPQLGSYLCSH
jgi:hypothetical protein